MSNPFFDHPTHYGHTGSDNMLKDLRSAGRQKPGGHSTVVLAAPTAEVAEAPTA